MKKGFTLIELLVVIAIIGILAGLTLVSYTGARKQTRDTQRKSDLGQYRTALEAYSAANDGLYPEFDGSFDVISTGICDTQLKTVFMSDCLEDPNGTGTYLYKYQSSADRYTYLLYADLETTNYWEVCSNGKSGNVAVEPADVTCDL